MYASDHRNRRRDSRSDHDHMRMDVSVEGAHKAIPHALPLGPATLPSRKRGDKFMVQRNGAGDGEPPAKPPARLPVCIDSRPQRLKMFNKSKALRKKSWSSNGYAKSFSASSTSAPCRENARQRITHPSTGSVMGKSAAVLAGKRLASDKAASKRNDETVQKQERRQQMEDSTGQKQGNDTILLVRKRVQPTLVRAPEIIRTSPTSESEAEIVSNYVSTAKRIRTELVLASISKPVDRPLTPPTKFPNDTVATVEDLKSHCWTCKSRIQQVNGHESFYAMHVHPILKVPCCILCCEEVEAMEVPDDQDDLEQCCACAMDGDDLLLCDVCPSGFCTTCVAQAWGGGRSGLQQVEQLASDSSRSWACIRCNPPSALRALQIPDQEESMDIREENNEDESAVKEIVATLDAVEDDLDHCDHLMELDNVQRLQTEIRAELAETIHCKEELDKAVTREITLWKEKHMEHATRVQDYKVDLLERLNKHGFSDDQYYNYRAESKPKQVDDYDSEWRRNADAEIQKRLQDEEKLDAEHKKWKKEQMLDDEDDSDDSVAEEKVALAEVEDLCNDSTYEEWETEEVLDFRKKWHRCEFESREQREKKQNRYLARDDVYLKNAGARVTKVDKDSDAETTRREFAFVSFKSGSGVPIRRDAILAMRQNATNQKRSLAFTRKDAIRTNSSSVSPHGANCIRSQTQGKAKSIGSSPRKQEGLQSMTTSTSTRLRCGHRNQNVGTAHEVECKPFIGDAFWNSCVELCSEDEGNGTRTVRLASALASKLKPHQVDGIKFMWQNACNDLSTISTREEALEERGIGGCILAHLMGLGKTLQIITLMHTLLHHPALRPPGNGDTNSFVRKILLIVPVNTIVNWTNEFEKWTGGLKHSVRYFDYSSVQTSNRQKMVQNWSETGGVLLIGADAFVRLVKKEKDTKLFHDPGPDMVIVDEAHSLVKNQSSEFSKVLGPIRTKRRITLTGTPFVNNLKEYFKLADWCRPGTLGTFAHFEKTYAQKIMAGLASDSTTHQVAQQVRTSMMLSNKMAPFMQRRGVSFLTRDLPPSQTVVLYIRQSKLQARLYRSFEKYAKGLKGSNKLSFIAHYQMLRPLHNHPTCLLEQAKAKSIHKNVSAKQKEKKSVLAASVNVKAELKGNKQHNNTKEIVDLTEVLNDHIEGESGWNSSLGMFQESLPLGDKKDMEYSWMDRILAKTTETAFTSVKNGYKIFLLLQILANANCLGDKVVVFSQCLKTLDFIETVLNTHDWARFCKGFESDKTLGSWRKGADYLRIDGSVNASVRGDLVSSFHQTVGGVKVFLLSIEAGGIGINLTAANRVVIFDNHWNPTVSSQAFHRCYRYGQEKPVFGYRFITQGSMEEKIYKRSMKKSGIAARVVDQQFPERNFTDREMAEIQSIDNWVQCDRCNKWRILFFKNEEDLPDKWYCEMNNDPLNNKCTAEERCGDWYEKNSKRIEEMIEKNLDGDNAVNSEGLDLENKDSSELATKDLVKDNVHNRAEVTKEDLVQKDNILVAMGLLDFFDVSKHDSAKGTPISVISDIQFQELLQTESADLEIEASHAEAELALASEETASVIEVSTLSRNQTVQSMKEPHLSIVLSRETSRATHRLTDSIATDTHEELVQDEGVRKTPEGVPDMGCEELPVVVSTSIAAEQQPNQRNDSKAGDATIEVCSSEPTNPRGPQAIGPPRKVTHRSTSTGKSFQDAIEVHDDSEDEMDMSLFYEIARTLF